MLSLAGFLGTKVSPPFKGGVAETTKSSNVLAILMVLAGVMPDVSLIFFEDLPHGH